MKNYLFIKRGLLSAFIVLISFVSAHAVNVTVTLTTSTSSPIEGAIVQYNQYSGGWQYFGTTDVNGEVIGDMPTLNATSQYAKVRLFYNGQRSLLVQQNIVIDNTIDFNTIPVSLSLKNSNGDDIESDNAQYYASGWKTFGDGGTPETIELLPGSLYFKVWLNGLNTHLYRNISNDPDIIFTTAKVKFHFTGNSWYYNPYAGGNPWKLLETDSIELFPNKLMRFRFNGAGYPFALKYLIIPEEGIDKTVQFVKFTSSLGNGIDDAPTQVFIDNWIAGNKTINNGTCINLLDGMVDTVTTRLYHGGAYQDIEQDLSEDSFIDFNTVLATMSLKDSQENQLEFDDAEYYANGWQNFPLITPGGGLELLPQNYPFRVHYAGGSSMKSQDINADPNVGFQTVAVTMQLKDSRGNDLASSNAIYSDGSWMQFGDGITTETIELLPSEYKFRVLYAGAIMDRDQNVGEDATVNFTTVPVTLNVYDDNLNVVEGYDATYSFAGSIPFGDGLSPEVVELLPVTYTFSVMYDGEELVKSQNSALNPNVKFTSGDAIPALNIEDIIAMELAEEKALLDQLDKEENLPIIDAAVSFTQTSATIYPNPFTTNTSINYKVMEEGNVTITIYDINGNVVSVLKDGVAYKGEHQLFWDGTDTMGNKLPTGTYIYKSVINGKIDSKALILQR